MENSGTASEMPSVEVLDQAIHAMQQVLGAHVATPAQHVELAQKLRMLRDAIQLGLAATMYVRTQQQTIASLTKELEALRAKKPLSRRR